MSTYDDVQAQLKTAMKARDADRLRALRGIRAALIEALKTDASKDTLSDDEVQAILFKLAKQRRESIDAYTSGGRDDLVAKEQAELEVIEGFLPKLADEAQTREWARRAIEATGASGMSDMGKVMGHLMANHRTQLDGKLASDVVREMLQAG